MKRTNLILVLLCCLLLPVLGVAQANITAMEYYINTDPGYGSATAIPIVSATEQDIELSVNTSSLAPGFHTLYVRARNVDGVWGLSEARSFYITEIPAPEPVPVATLEYFFDVDPGAGSATAIDVTAGTVLDVQTSLASTALEPGFHTLSVRARNADGVWGMTESRAFFVTDTTSASEPLPIAQVEYFFNEDPGVGSATAIDITSDMDLDLKTSLAAASLDNGFHTLSVRARNSVGVWGLTESRAFYLTETPTESEPIPIANFEYFIGTDPGYGSGTMITVSEPAVYLDMSTLIPAAGLEPGSYMLSVRAQNANGVWGLHQTEVFALRELSAPELLSPENESIDVPLTVVFSWSVVDSAQSYQLQLSKTNDFAVIEIDSSGINETALTIDEALLELTTSYFWRVRAWDADGEGTWSQVRSFTTLSIPSPELLTPEDESTQVPLPVTFAWSEVAEAQSYQLQLSKTSEFAVMIVDSTITDTTIVSIDESYLELLTTYYWRVRSVVGTDSGPWTDSRSFTTGYNPAVPVLLAPSDEATGIPINATLAWELAARADSYDIEVATDASFEELVYPAAGKPLADDNSGMLSTSDAYAGFLLSDLIHSTTYFWRVRGSNEFGQSSWTEAWQFTTVEEGIPPVVLQSPAMGSEDVPIPVTLTWQTVGGAIHYGVEVSTNPAFTNRTVYDSLEVASLGLVSLSDTTTYFWRVRAYAADRDASVSAVWEFRTELRLPETPIWEPADMSVDIDSMVVLKWTPVARADRYDVQLGTDILFEDDPSLFEGLDITELELDGLKLDAQYYWRVRGVNTRGVGGWSEALRFHTTVSISADLSEIPTEAALSQNYPNPFNPSTVIGFQLPVFGEVRLAVYDVLGRQVAVMVNGTMPAGHHQITFDASNHLYRLEAGGQVFTRRMTLLK